MAIGVYLVVALSLIGPLGMAGLVLANSAQWISHAIIMLVLVSRMMGGLQGLGVKTTLAKTAVSGLAMGVARWAVLATMGSLVLRQGFIVNVSLIITAGAAGVVVFGAGAWLQRMDEIRQLLAGLRRKT